MRTVETVEYIAEFKESNSDDYTRQAQLSLGDYKNWEEVLASPILWGSINFTYGRTLVLKKHEKFPTDTKSVTFFDKNERWAYVRVLKISKKHITTTTQLVWDDDSMHNESVRM